MKTQTKERGNAFEAWLGIVGKLDKQLQYTYNWHSKQVEKSLSNDLLECGDALKKLMEITIYSWECSSEYKKEKKGRFIRVLLKRIERLCGASRFDLHIFRVEANENISLPF